MNLFKMSFFGSIIILAILAIRFILKDRLPKKLLWALWIIAIFRLIIPFEIPFEYSISSLVESGIQDIFKDQRMLQFDLKSEHGENLFELSFLEELSKLAFQGENQESLKDPKFNEIVKAGEADQKQGFEHVKNAGSEHAINSDSLNAKNTNSLNAQQDISKKGFNQAFEVSSNRIKIGNPIFILWLVGFSICAFVYLKLYASYYRKFNQSEEVKDAFVLTWLKEHPISRKIKVKSACALISSQYRVVQ